MLRFYTEKSIGFVCWCMAKNRMPNATKEERDVYAHSDELRRQVARTCLQRDFEETLVEKYHEPGFARFVIDELYPLIPDEILPNIAEWCEDKEFSDIVYKDVTLNQIKNWPKNKGANRCVNRELDMISILKAFTGWIRDKCDCSFDEYMSWYISWTTPGMR